MCDAGDVMGVPRYVSGRGGIERVGVAVVVVVRGQACRMSGHGRRTLGSRRGMFVLYKSGKTATHIKVLWCCAVGGAHKGVCAGAVESKTVGGGFHSIHAVGCQCSSRTGVRSQRLQAEARAERRMLRRRRLSTSSCQQPPSSCRRALPRLALVLLAW